MNRDWLSTVTPMKVLKWAAVIFAIGVMVLALIFMILSLVVAFS